MKPFYIIFQFIFILFICFAATFLMDLDLIKSNWLRYCLVVFLIFSILLVGLLWIKQTIKKL